MRFVLINTLMQSSRRFQHRLLSHLQPPSADLPLPRKDHTGFILRLSEVEVFVMMQSTRG